MLIVINNIALDRVMYQEKDLLKTKKKTKQNSELILCQFDRMSYVKRIIQRKIHFVINKKRNVTLQHNIQQQQITTN